MNVGSYIVVQVAGVGSVRECRVLALALTLAQNNDVLRLQASVSKIRSYDLREYTYPIGSCSSNATGNAPDVIISRCFDFVETREGLLSVISVSQVNSDGEEYEPFRQPLRYKSQCNRQRISRHQCR